jgi:hypothetical protein
MRAASRTSVMGPLCARAFQRSVDGQAGRPQRRLESEDAAESRRDADRPAHRTRGRAARAGGYRQPAPSGGRPRCAAGSTAGVAACEVVACPCSRSVRCGPRQDSTGRGAGGPRPSVGTLSSKNFDPMVVRMPAVIPGPLMEHVCHPASLRSPRRARARPSSLRRSAVTVRNARVWIEAVEPGEHGLGDLPVRSAYADEPAKLGGRV